jgi:uncharacterized membrane protein
VWSCCCFFYLFIYDGEIFVDGLFFLLTFVLCSFGLFLLWKVYLCLVVPREVNMSPLSVVLGGRFFFERKRVTDSGFVEFIGVLY